MYFLYYIINNNINIEGARRLLMLLCHSFINVTPTTRFDRKRSSSGGYSYVIAALYCFLCCINDIFKSVKT
jgi:hypothetical protein